MIRAAPSLLAIVVRRIVFFSAVAMLAQFIGVFREYWSDDQQLNYKLIEVETTELAGGLRRAPDGIRFELPAVMIERYANGARGYYARLRKFSGEVIYTNVDAATAEQYFVSPKLVPPNLWMTQLKVGKPLNSVGGRIFDFAKQQVVIEVAVLDDRDNVLYTIMAHEIADHMILPMSLILIVVLGASAVSILQALRPVRNVAKLVSKLDPLIPASRLPLQGIPSEILKFARAVNTAFDRVGELVRSQKLLTSAISHEVKTPLAIARLELEKITDPRARKVEKDLDAINELVEQLTTLARLEGFDMTHSEPVDPTLIAENVVTALAPTAYAADKTLEIIHSSPQIFAGHPALVENAVRNLVANAIRHTDVGTHIRVEVGPGAQFCVHDDGAKVKNHRSAENAHKLGLGLKIVNRIAEIHGGSFEFSSVPNVTTTAKLDFGSQAGGGQQT